MIIRAIAAADLAAIVAIQQAAGFNSWTEAQITASMQVGNHFLLEVAENIVGFALYSSVLDEAELLNIVIAREQQAQGYGRELLRLSLQALGQAAIERCFLEVGRSNQAAIALYEKLGFEQVSMRKNYYQHDGHNEDALVMQLYLNQIGEQP
jgi:ribosomal-protein-alanine N-acetyltransferase